MAWFCTQDTVDASPPVSARIKQLKLARANFPPALVSQLSTAIASGQGDDAASYKPQLRREVPVIKNRLSSSD